MPLGRRSVQASSKKTVSVFIPHQGCPNDCVFCNQRKITGVEREFSLDEIEDNILDCLATIKSEHVELAFFGGSFTAIPIQQQKSLLTIANKFRSKGFVQEIRISTRPDAINEEVLSFLKENGVGIIELGLQSLSDEVLQASNRGHDAQCVFQSSELILKNGFKLGLQMMIGLPADNEERLMKTVEEIITIGPHFVRIYPVLVIKDTELESLFKNKRYEPLSVEEAARLAKQAYLRFQSHSIKVIRIGLQATERLTGGEDVVAGPFHPAFGEIVYSLIFKDILEIFLEENPSLKGKKIKVEVPGNRISQWVGISKSNLRYFEGKYGITQSIGHCSSMNAIRINETEISLKQFFD